MRVIRRNAEALGLPGAVPCPDKVERLVQRKPDEPYDLVFADPPYALADASVTALLENLRDQGWAAPDALVVVERAARGPALRWPDGYEAERDRRYGEAIFWYGRAEGR
jgi:16S rRNA (guanine966-N2)-methyltransferase